MTLCQTQTSCCTRSVEQRLGAWSERQYRDALHNKTADLLAELDTRATQVDGENRLRFEIILLCSSCRLHLCAVEQGPTRVPRNVHADIRWVSIHKSSSPSLFFCLHILIAGVMYQKNADVFQEYFQDLKIYYEKGNINPADSTSSFFTTLYQKMFKVLLLIEPSTGT